MVLSVLAAEVREGGYRSAAMSNRITQETKDAIAALRRSGATWRTITLQTGVSFCAAVRHGSHVDAGPCGCGRPAGHKGHCSIKLAASAALKNGWGNESGKRRSWCDTSEAVLRVGYETGADLADVAESLVPLLGYKPTLLALYAKGEKCGFKRPADYWDILKQRKALGRKKGSKNKRPYARTGYRPTKPPVAPLLVVTVQAPINKPAPRAPFSMSAMRTQPRAPMPAPVRPVPTTRIESAIVVPPQDRASNGSRHVGHAPTSLVSLERARALERLAQPILAAKRCQTVTNPGSFGFGITFCDAPSVEGKSYCADCCKRYFVRVPRRQAGAWAAPAPGAP